MAKARSAGKSPKKTTKAEVRDEEIVLGPSQQKAIKLVDKSAKVRAELEGAVMLAIAKAVRKCMKDNNLDLTAPEASLLALLWFGDE